MNDRLFPFHLLPLEALLAAGCIEALAVLPRGVEQAPRHFGHDVAVFDLEGGRFEGERAVVTLNQIVADAAGAVADDALGMLPQERKARADTMRRVVHRR